MATPIDYLGMIPRPDLGGALLQGLQTGSAIREVRDKRSEADAEAQYAADLQAAFDNPTPQSFAALIAKYPGQRKALNQSWGLLDKDQQDSEFGIGTQVYGALRSGRADVAAGLLDEQITATENAGRDATSLRTIRQQIERDPNGASAQIGLVLSSIDPDRWGKVASELRAAEQAPYDLSEKQAKAQKAAVDARFAESAAVMDLEKKGWDIRKMQEDMAIARQNSRIAAMNAQIKGEENSLKRAELQQKLADAQLKRDETIREKVATVSSARAGIDNALNTIDRLVQNPELDNILGAVEGSDYYPSTIAGLVSPFSNADQRADAMAALETVQSQSFLNNLMEAKSQGATFGALTEKEGDRLISYVQSLSRKQSEKQFKDNLSEVQRLLLKSRANLSTRYGVPDVVPDTPAAAPAPSEIEALLQKYGGAR